MENEATRQFQRIWEEHHDPEFQRRKKQKELKEKRKQEVAVDYGIDESI